MEAITNTLSNSPLAVVGVTISVGVVTYLLFKQKKTPSSNLETWENHILPHSKLNEISSGLWQVTGSNPRGPPRNMTIYRLPDKSLLIHSCVAVNDEVLKDILSLGDPSIVIVPNSFHRMDIAVWKQKFPKCKVICPKKAQKGVEEKIKVEGICEDILPSFGIKCIEVKGADKLDELVYEIPLSNGKKALICCDILFNMGPEHTNIFTKILGNITDGIQPRVSRIMKFFVISNKPMFRKFLSELVSNEHEILLVAHGNPVKGNIQQKVKVVADSL